MFDFAGETRLPSGATLIDSAPKPHETSVTIVLARHGDGKTRRWVTWCADDNGVCYWGHYFTDLTLATRDFAERTGQSVPDDPQVLYAEIARLRDRNLKLTGALSQLVDVVDGDDADEQDESFDWIRELICANEEVTS